MIVFFVSLSAKYLIGVLYLSIPDFSVAKQQKSTRENFPCSHEKISVGAFLKSVLTRLKRYFYSIFAFGNRYTPIGVRYMRLAAPAHSICAIQHKKNKKPRYCETPYILQVLITLGLPEQSIF